LGLMDCTEWALRARERFDKPAGWRYDSVTEEPPVPAGPPDDIAAALTAGRAVEVGVLSARNLPPRRPGVALGSVSWRVRLAGMERTTAAQPWGADGGAEWGERLAMALPAGGKAAAAASAPTAAGELRIELLQDGGRQLGAVKVAAERMAAVARAPRGWAEERWRVVMSGEQATAGRGYQQCMVLVGLRVLEAGEWVR
jgi:hypothetical protein